MINRYLQIGLITLAAAGSLSVYGKPAKQGVLTVTDADGRELRVRLAGDEFFHQYFTEDGYPLIEKNGRFFYGDIDAAGQVIDSGIRATSVSERSAAAASFLSKIEMNGLEQRIARRSELSPRYSQMVQRRQTIKMVPALAADGNDGPPFERGYGLFTDVHFPAYGDQKAIVILVEYSDVKFKDTYDAGDYFTRMLNEDGFADYGGTGCAAEYFRLNSGDTFRPEFDVFGPVTLPHNQAYYGANDWFGNDERPGQMIKDACDAIDDTVDFSDYDRDGDGIVDNVFVFYAGKGEASGGSANTIWPHSWDMVSAGFSNLCYDGVRLHTYGCSNEWESGRPDGVGTFIHEFSHVMGLPDLYATNYSGAFTPGAWSALDYGPYNNDGTTPPLYGAFERYALGWIKPREVKGPMTATLQPISQNVCGIIRTDKDTEFFLLENRQQESWDKYIPGHGMLIWHVDYNESVWNSNSVNNQSNHQYVDLEEADGTASEYSRGGDAFPGTANKTAFTPETTPALMTWSRQAVNYPITDIAENAGLITFNVLGGAEVDIPTPSPAEVVEVSFNSFKLAWTPAEGYDAILNVYTYPETAQNEDNMREAADLIYVPGYRNLNLGSASEVVVEGLEPHTLYYYTMALSNGWQTSDFCREEMAFTGEMTIEYRHVEALEPEDVKSDSFKARWQEVEGATGYLVTLYEMLPDQPYLDVCDFSDGINNLHGWDSTSNLTYAMEAYCGESSPSLRMSSGSALTSPLYDDEISGVSFWHRGSNTTDGDLVRVYAIAAGSREMVGEFEVVKTVGGQICEIESLPEGTHQIVIEFKRLGTKGYLALDDVKVSHGMQYAPVVVEGSEDMEAGNCLEMVVDGLKPQTPYAYTVRATDGTLFSKASQFMYVTTLSPASNINPSAGVSARIHVAGNVVTCNADAEIVVCDFSGAVVARGWRKVVLPRAGLYIVTVPELNYAGKFMAK